MVPVDEPADLVGLVLAGGRSRRMGVAKADLIFNGRTMLDGAVCRLERVGLPVVVSIRARQTAVSVNEACAVVYDAKGIAGPAAGLLAAWNTYPKAALLALAVDMPLVEEGLLRTLIGARNPRRLATVFSHADGTLEPLCTIWEPSARSLIASRVSTGSCSLRKLLESADVQELKLLDPGQLRSVNTPEEFEVALTLIERARRPEPGL